MLDYGTGGFGHLANNLGNVSTAADQPDGAGDSLDFAGNANTYLGDMGLDNVAWDGAGNDLTIALWFNADAWTNFCRMFAWVGSGNDIALVRLVVDASFDYVGYTQYDTDTTSIAATSNVADSVISTWYHVVCTYDSTSQTNSLYIDDTFIDSAADVSMDDLESTATALRLGSESYNGKLWSFGIWDTVLDADQRTALYNSGNGGTYSDFYTPSFGTNPTSTNLFAWWSLSGLTDELGNYNMTNNGTATFTSGYNANAVTLNGTSQYLSNAAGTGAFPTGAQTWACFIKQDVEEAVDVFGKFGGAGQYSILLRVGTSGVLAGFISGDGTALVSPSATKTISANSWAHIALVYDPDAATPYCKTYIDGVEAAVSTTSIPTSLHDSTADVTIGLRDGGTNQHFDGQIDDCCVFDKALSADEVKWLVHNSYADL